MSLFGRGPEATDPGPQDEGFLLRHPAPAWSEFAGAETIDKGAILRWRTEYGTVGLVYSVPFAHHSAHRFVNALRQKYGSELPKFYASVVSAGLTMGWYGPDLEALDIQRGGKVSDVYRPICEEVARIIGTAVPIWPSMLRDLETIKTWKPGAAPAVGVGAVDAYPGGGEIGQSRGEPRADDRLLRSARPRHASPCDVARRTCSLAALRSVGMRFQRTIWR